MTKKPSLCIVGLGYVGMPLAHAFAKAGYEVYGFDVDATRIDELTQGNDRTNELSDEELKSVKIAYSTDPAVIGNAAIIILAIPTPVDTKNKPDLTLLKSATHMVANHVRDGATVVYESTVYPGVTEEICGSILKSKKKVKLGYSPERMNPGDREHTIEKIVKVVAGEDAETTEALATLYGSIVKAGIHRASSIKVAEMAKAIENAQRDLNIAYVNEIAKFCHALGIATKDVLDAAGTKWNFLPFKPGLVGGHCIGVDPYYLLEKGKEIGSTMEIITAARHTNDGMANYVADQVRTILGDPGGKAVLILGHTFKENVPDTRNSQSLEVSRALSNAEYKVAIKEHDPYTNEEKIPEGPFDAILLLVPHREYLEMTPAEFKKLAKQSCLFYDLKSVFDRKEMKAIGFTYMAL